MLIALFVILAGLAGALGGALSALKLAGKAIGKELALMMGAFFGLMPVVPAAVAVALYFTIQHH